MINATAYTTGLTTALTLIMAIGAQNAFVLRQGLRNEHVFVVVMTCALSDAILISFGVSSFHKIIAAAPWVESVMRYGGAAFLIWYGCKSLISAFRSTGALVTSDQAVSSLRNTVMTCLAFTWLNPHVYLDTVMLIGTISTRFPGEGVAFASGAITASFLFFFSLGYAAKWLRPLLAKPASWRFIEGSIALVMFFLAKTLLFGG
jgi:L-lysine exporter family protein LysE/ArgO